MWSLLSLVPLYMYCYRFLPLRFLWLYSAASLLPAFIPNSFYDRIQLSSRTMLYRKLGVRTLNKIVQNGAFVNRSLRKKFPGSKPAPVSGKAAGSLILRTYMYEKFHAVFFVFFLLAALFALYNGQFGWSLLLCFINIFYNILPNLLQQYIRVRLKDRIRTGS